MDTTRTNVRHGQSYAGVVTPMTTGHAEILLRAYIATYQTNKVGEDARESSVALVLDAVQTFVDAAKEARA